MPCRARTAPASCPRRCRARCPTRRGRPPAAASTRAARTPSSAAVPRSRRSSSSRRAGRPRAGCSARRAARAARRQGAAAGAACTRGVGSKLATEKEGEPMSRRVRSKAALVAGVALVAAAAYGASTGSAGPAVDTLVVDRSFEIRTADPQRAFEPTASIVNRGMYDTLLTFRGGDVSRPVLLAARGYRASRDAKTYTFDLRRDIRFADGTPMTAADVVFSFRRLINLKGNPVLPARRRDGRRRAARTPSFSARRHRTRRFRRSSRTPRSGS